MCFLFCFIFRSINPQWIYAVFGVQTIDQLNTEYAENHLGKIFMHIYILLLSKDIIIFTKRLIYIFYIFLFILF